MKKIIYGTLVLALATVAIYSSIRGDERKSTDAPDNSNTKYSYYKTSEYGPEFTYPAQWGQVTLKEGNKTCPEEDTYRTPDSLHVFDWEFSFPEIKLPGSESMIRIGIRLHDLNPKKLSDCGDDFHLKIAQKEVTPETLSSFRLNSITNKNGLTGTFNPEASRLNTEARTQFTFFIPENIGGRIHVLQPYFSFIPYFSSPELTEMEEKFKGDMAQYLREGKTANNIRLHLAEFIKMSESLKFITE